MNDKLSQPLSRGSGRDVLLRLAVIAAALPVQQRVRGGTEFDGREALEMIRFLCDANESALRSLRTVEVVYTREKSIVWPGRRDRHSKMSIEWWSDGESDRVRSYVRALEPGAPKTSLRDVLLHEERVYLLRGYDWTSPRELELADHSVIGSIRSRTREALQANPLADFLFHVQWTPFRRTLSELVRDTVGPMQLREVDGSHGKVWQLELTTPEDGRRLEIQVDPGANYLVRQVVRHPTDAEASQFNYPTVTFFVEQFDELLPGVNFPTVVKTRSTVSDDGSLTETVLEIASIKVNEPLREDAFKLTFPKNVSVVDKIANVTYVWGENEPAHTVRSVEEDEALARRLLGRRSGREGDARSGGSLSGVTFWVVNGLVILLIASVLVWKRIGRR